MDKADIIYGTRAVMEAAKAGRPIEKVYLQAGLNNDLLKELVGLMREKQVPYTWVPLEKINRLTRGNHQGVVAVLPA